MTIITGRQFRANQGKYIDMAHHGEDVVLSSKKGYVRLTPVQNEDKAVTEYEHNVSMMAFATKIKKEHDSIQTVRCENLEELHQLLNSL